MAKVLLAIGIAFSAAVNLLAPPAPSSHSRDPILGPHARDEALHGHDLLRFKPVHGPIVPRQLPQPAPAVALVPGWAQPGALSVTPAPLAKDGPLTAVPASLTSSGGALTREVFGFAPYWELTNRAGWNYNLLSTVAYFGLDVKGDGSFDTSTSGWSGWTSGDLVDVINGAHQAGDRVVVVIKQFDEASIDAIVTTSAGDAAIQNTINAIASKNLDGVNVDFEGYASSSYPNIQSGLTSFMSRLSSQVHARWPAAMVSIDTYSGAAGWDNGLFNIGQLAPVVDAFFVMAYDMVFSNMSGQAGPNAPLNGWTYNDTLSVSQYLAKAPASKVILGVPYYGYKWSTSSNQPYASTSGGATADTYSAIQDDFACAPSLTKSWDSTAASPWASWYSPATNDPCGGNHGSWRELYYDDAQSLGMKYDLVNAQGLRGAGMWALGYDGTFPDLWRAIQQKFAPVWSASYGVSGVPRTWIVGQPQSVSVSVTNTGNQPWPAGGSFPVQLNLHFAIRAGGYPDSGAWITSQFASLPQDVQPGQTATVTTIVTPPPGAIVLEAEMVRIGQFWFRTWAPVAVGLGQPVFAASYDMSAVPRTWTPGQAQTFSVTVTNTGNQAWPAGGPYPVNLNLHFAIRAGGYRDYGAWITSQFFALPQDVAPGQSVKLAVTLTAPAGAVVLEAEALRLGQFWFLEWAPVAISPATVWAATYDLSGVPRSWVAGETKSFSVTVTNTGNQTWRAGGSNPVNLNLHFATGIGGYPASSTWLTSQFFALPADVPPGGASTVAVTVTAPGAFSATVLEAEMVQLGQFWFLEWDPAAVTVASPVWAAAYDLSGMPRSWVAGQAQSFPVKVTNTGNQAWPSTGASAVNLNLHFSSVVGGYPHHDAWLSSQFFALPADVAPGDSVTVQVTESAPATSIGAVNEAEMVRLGQFWFLEWAALSLGLTA